MQSAKCVMVGDGSVGKSCIFFCYTNNEFPDGICPIISNFRAKITVPGGAVSLDLTDVVGMEDYEKIRMLLYPQTDVFIICFSIASPSSYDSVKDKWCPEVRHYCPNVPILLVGTKKDLRNNPEVLKRLQELNQAPVTTQQGINLSRHIRAIKYMECSALNQEGIKEVFMEAARAVLNRAPVKPNTACRLL